MSLKNFGLGKNTNFIHLCGRKVCRTCEHIDINVWLRLLRYDIHSYTFSTAPFYFINLPGWTHWEQICDRKQVFHVRGERNWALLEKPPVVQLHKNFSIFYGTRRFITVFTRALHLVPILSEISLFHTIPSSLSKIHFNIVHPPTSWYS
jgi:hypothetical protein